MVHHVVVGEISSKGIDDVVESSRSRHHNYRRSNSQERSLFGRSGETSAAGAKVLGDGCVDSGVHVFVFVVE